MAISANKLFPSLAPLLRSGARFFGWWAGELAGLVPEKIRLWWRGTDQVVFFRQDHSSVSLSRLLDGKLSEIHSFRLDEGDASRHRLETNKRLRETIGRDFSLLVCLPAERVLRRTVHLPLAVEENLQQVITYELDRYTPFKPDQAYFSCRAVERNLEKRQLVVELAVTPRPVVDQANAQATALGFAADGAVVPEDVLQRHHDFFNLLPLAAKKPRRPSFRLRWRLVTALLSALLLATLLAIPIWQKRTAAIALLEPLAKAKSAAKEADGAREQLTKLVEEHNFLPDRKWASYSVLQVLDELTKLLPDDTFVVQLDFDGKSVQVHGETASSGTLVQTVEASPVFKEASFKSQLTKVQGTASDRFHLAATLEPPSKPKPEATPAAGAGHDSSPSPMTSPGAGTGGKS